MGRVEGSPAPLGGIIFPRLEGAGPRGVRESGEGGWLVDQGGDGGSEGGGVEGGQEQATAALS